MHGGRLIELMAKYGDTNLENYGDTYRRPEFYFPSASPAQDPGADSSFTGYQGRFTEIVSPIRIFSEIFS